MLKSLCQIIILAALASAASRASAAEASYVFCDNGLDCVTQPCPSNNALDIESGQVIKGVFIDIDALPASDRAALERSSALYHGKVVLRGGIERRDKVFHGNTHNLAFLVVTAVERDATAVETAHCRG